MSIFSYFPISPDVFRLKISYSRESNKQHVCIKILHGGDITKMYSDLFVRTSYFLYWMYYEKNYPGMLLINGEVSLGGGGQ